MGYNETVFLKSMKRFIYVIACAVISMACMHIEGAFAAHLFMEPKTQERVAGDVFMVDVKMDVTPDECINAAEVFVAYPSQFLQAMDVNIGESFFSLWVQKPAIDKEKGIISFVGGVPGGYCGRVSGDPGTSNMLAQMVFRLPSFSVGKEKINMGNIAFLPETSVMLNDGTGTPAALTMEGADITLVEKTTTSQPVNEWRQRLVEDKMSPEPFAIEVRREDQLYKGKYILFFSTLDKQTGVDHFEVQEIFKKDFDKGTRDAVWHIAESPYMLVDQSLQSVIRVKAIDKAGNERIVEYVPSDSLAASAKSFFYPPLIVGIILVAAGVLLMAVLVLKKRKHNSHS